MENNNRPGKGYMAALILAITACVVMAAGFVYKTVYDKTEEAVSVSLSRSGEEEKTGRADRGPEAIQTAASSDAAVALAINGADIGTTEMTNGAVAFDVSGIVDSVMPCVVAITDNLEVTQSASFNPYYFFFGGQPDSSVREEAASGSGVIIGQNDSELLILTNNHVVSNEGSYSSYSVTSTGLSVAFVDGTTADVSVKATSDEMDLAVLSVSLDDISAETKDAIKIAVVGSSDDIKVGNGVIAIGNALGYGQSVTFGIISAKDRVVTFESDITNTVMQVDAAINHGNSGGGLFNLQGELVGINEGKAQGSDVDDVGFAIPISNAEAVIEDMMNKQVIPEADQGYLGVNGETVPESYITNYAYPAGVVITRIGAGSPAETAGLQIYDIVTAVDGREVATMDSLKEQVNSHPAGDTVVLSVSRPDGRSFKEIEIPVTLVRYEDITMTTEDE